MSGDAPDIVHASEIAASAVFLFAAMGTGTLSLYVVGRWAWLRGGSTKLLRDSRRARASAAGILVVGLAAAVWGWCIEPGMLRVTTLHLESPKLAPGAGKPLRLVFISDLHVEPGWRMAGKLARRVAELEPDAILLGGDYLNAGDPESLGTLAAEARGLAAVAPTYAVLGNVDVQHVGVSDLLRRSGIRVLDGESVGLEELDELGKLGKLGGRVRVFGAGYLDAAALGTARAGSDPTRFDICLTHAPGIIPQAAAAGFDLYLSGHTHGGQVRVPLWGALMTLAVHGKRFECGRYDVDGMVAYVTRGVGLEGGRLAPRVRFLCAPEIVIIEIERADTAGQREPRMDTR